MSLLVPLLWLSGGACGLIEAAAREKKCADTAQRQIQTLKAESIKLFPAGDVVDVTEWDDCDEGGESALLQVRLTGKLPAEAVLRGFVSAGWSPLPRYESNLPAREQMCYGCVAGAMKTVDGRVIYIAISSGSDSLLYARVNFQGAGPLPTDVTSIRLEAEKSINPYWTTVTTVVC